MDVQRMSQFPLCKPWRGHAAPRIGKSNVGWTRTSRVPKHQRGDQRIVGAGATGLPKDHIEKGAVDEQPLGMAGNCVMLTQPKSSEIIKTLPPSPAGISDSFAVLFTTGRQDVRKAKMLEVPRQQYLRCAKLRAKVCEVFADVSVSEEVCQRHSWKEHWKHKKRSTSSQR